MKLNYRVIKYLFLFAIATLLIMWPEYSYAEQEAAAIRTVTDRISEVTSRWHDALRPAMLSLFWTLIFISFAYSIGKMALMGSDLPEIASEIVKTILLIGFWLYIIEYSYEFANAIIDSLGEAANISSGKDGNIHPGGIIERGVKLASEMMGQASGIGKKIIFGLYCIIIVVLYFYIAAIVFVMQIETYIVTGMSIILLGFAGSPWTSDISKKYFLFTFSVGMKFFATIIVVRLGEELVRETITPSSSYAQAFTIMGIIFLLAYLTKRIPDMAQAMVSGVSVGNGNEALGMAAATGKAVVGAMVGAGFSFAQALVAGASNGDKSANSQAGSGSPTLEAAAMGGFDSSGSKEVAANDSNPAALPNSGSGASPGKPKASTSDKSKRPEPAAPVKNDPNGGSGVASRGTDSGAATSTGDGSDAIVPASEDSSAAEGGGQSGDGGGTGRSRVGAVAAYAARASAAYGKARLQTTWERMIDSGKFDVGLKIRENKMAKKINDAGNDKNGNKK